MRCQRVLRALVSKKENCNPKFSEWYVHVLRCACSAIIFFLFVLFLAVSGLVDRKKKKGMEELPAESYGNPFDEEDEVSTVKSELVVPEAATGTDLESQAEESTLQPTNNRSSTGSSTLQSGEKSPLREGGSRVGQEKEENEFAVATRGRVGTVDDEESKPSKEAKQRNSFEFGEMKDLSLEDEEKTPAEDLATLNESVFVTLVRNLPPSVSLRESITREWS